MINPGYPFAAIVGQPVLKRALLLASVDWRLSVLLQGDKGSGKSTAARGLADILPAGAPFMNVPIGTTEDRLLGGLDLDQALRGQARLQRGLIQQADGGVLYIDEVNLLSDALTDALLDVASSGRHHVERDGFSAFAEARFILLGSMNLEEGALRPQLLDRFALALNIEAPAAAEERRLIVQARLRFDADPGAFCAEFEEAQQRLRLEVVAARAAAAAIQPSGEALQAISHAVAAAGVRSLRADLAALRAAIAHAALSRRAAIEPEDIEMVLPLVLHHRAKRSGHPPPPPPQPPQSPRNPPMEEPGSGSSQAADRVFSPEARRAPELRASLTDARARGHNFGAWGEAGGGARSGGSAPDAGLDVAASFTRSFRNTGSAALQSDHLVFRPQQEKSGVRFIFVVDASGSHAAQQRMRAVKGAAAALLESSVDRHDEVAVISFRGARAEIVLEPCRDAEAALRVLEFLPTGGRTPLAHALELAGGLANPACVLILLTDGRANVPSAGVDPWADALAAARGLACASILVDTSVDASTAAQTRELAEAMRARVIPLDALDEEMLVKLLRSPPTAQLAISRFGMVKPPCGRGAGRERNKGRRRGRAYFRIRA